MKMSKVFADFKRINTQCELRRTLEFMIGKTTYRVDPSAGALTLLQP